MKEGEQSRNRFTRLTTVQRQPVSLSTHQLVTKGYLPQGPELPLVLEPAVEGVDVSGWAEHHRAELDRELLTAGAILFRGFHLGGVEAFERLVRAISPDLLEYRERSSPRSKVGEGIYTSTDHPADQFIHFHNEQSYTQSWPMKIWFYCVEPAAQRGATPIADGRKVLKLLDPQTKERFMRKKVMYVRNYIDGIGLSWQEAFQTTDPAEVEAYCRQASIDFEWREGNRLRTSQVFDTIVSHPKTGEMLWFEHTAFFHVSSLEPAIQEAFLREYKNEDLPFNTYYGDGSPIEPAVLDEIRAAYRQTAVSFTWQKGDALLIDNMLTSHGREPFEGPRKIVVAMAELYFRKISQASEGQER